MDQNHIIKCECTEDRWDFIAWIPSLWYFFSVVRLFLPHQTSWNPTCNERLKLMVVILSLMNTGPHSKTQQKHRLKRLTQEETSHVCAWMMYFIFSVETPTVWEENCSSTSAIINSHNYHILLMPTVICFIQSPLFVVSTLAADAKGEMLSWIRWKNMMRKDTGVEFHSDSAEMLSISMLLSHGDNKGSSDLILFVITLVTCGLKRQ